MKLFSIKLLLPLSLFQLNKATEENFKSTIFYLIKDGFVVLNQNILGIFQVPNNDACLSRCLLLPECSGINLEFREDKAFNCTLLDITNSVADLSYQRQLGAKYFQRGQTKCMAGSICRSNLSNLCSFGRCIDDHLTKKLFQCTTAKEKKFFLKNATQSTTDHFGTADKAIDGKSGNHVKLFSCTHTSFEENPWWKADIGFNAYVTSVNITNRADCCQGRLLKTDFFVLRSKLAMKSWCAKVESVSKLHIQLNCSKPMLGDGILFQRFGLGALTLCEIEVFGIDPPDCIN